MNPVTVTLDLPAEAQARLEAEATRRGITLDQLIVEIADQLPAETTTPRRKLASVRGDRLVDVGTRSTRWR